MVASIERIRFSPGFREIPARVPGSVPHFSAKAVSPREFDWILWPWWRELQPGKPQRVEQPPPIAQVAEDPADRRGGELDQGGRDHDAVVQAALRLPQDVDDLELTAIGQELAAQGLEVGDGAYGCRLPICHVQAYHEGLASVGSLPHRQSLVGALRPFLRPARDTGSPPRRARTSRCRPVSSPCPPLTFRSTHPTSPPTLSPHPHTHT